MKKEIKIFASNNWVNYELLDTGDGEKLEWFGEHTFVRPYQDAVWAKTLKKEWENVNGKFSQKWQLSSTVPNKWEMEYKGIKFWASSTFFRHLSFFLEQATHWCGSDLAIPKPFLGFCFEFLNFSL